MLRRKKKTVILRTKVPYFSNNVKKAKIEKRKYERLWRKSIRLKLKNADQMKKTFQAARTKFSNILEHSKKTYYMDKIANCDKNQKKLYQILNGLLKRSCEQDLPDHVCNTKLVNKFNTFFVDKIRKIRSDLKMEKCDQIAEAEPEPETKLHGFTPISEQTVDRFISNSRNATCESDPLPTWLLKKCKKTVLPVITTIVNKSLTSGVFPMELKHALVRPKLKKQNLDKNEFKNYRPVSNIPYLSKIIEKAIITQLTHHMVNNDLIEPLQSAYRPNHSTETALLRIQNDILRDLDNRRGVILVLLDLSAAFDTIDHQILIQRLHDRIGLRANALRWFKSYHAQRTQSVIINGNTSEPIILDFGAPQGSLMGAEEYKVYTLPLGDIIRKHGLEYHIYADDGQLHVSFILNDKVDLDRAISTIKRCTLDIKKWMTANMLKLNDSKTEVIVITPSHRVNETKIQNIEIADSVVPISKKARNIGVIFDDHLRMHAHVTAVVKSCMMHLINISRIRQYIDQRSCETLVHALISFRSDYSNLLLYAHTKDHTDRL